ncbi:Uncharacterised protein [Mycobacteroides abscessus subsp. abscessus]|nr:Uncharacterised protein [Mycobacteroides abscessus subsp. abscessus]
MTSSTTPTLIAVITALTRDDSLVPIASSVVTPATMRIAPQSMVCEPTSTVPPEKPNTLPR